MKNTVFRDCRNMQQVMSKYLDLVYEFHPKIVGDNNAMSKIDQDYESLIQNPEFRFEKYPADEKSDFIKFKGTVNHIIGLGLQVDLFNGMLFLSGNTFPHRQRLSALGFRWFPKAFLWYYPLASWKKTQEITSRINSEKKEEVVS